MNWLLNSSIGKKTVMCITGISLVLFLLFHASMNLVAVISEDAYNALCALLGANWYAVAGTVVLAILVLLHFVFASLLTLQNRKARGSDRYAVSVKPKSVEWASQNMFVLGAIMGILLLLHLSQFWYKMMFAELMGHHEVALGGTMVAVQSGAEFIKYYFSHLWIVIAYLALYVALWLHLSHGFWSALQTIGWNNHLWMNRWKKIGKIYATVVCLVFAFVTLVFYFKS